jgi:hypothetical protein
VSNYGDLDRDHRPCPKCGGDRYRGYEQSRGGIAEYAVCEECGYETSDLHFATEPDFVCGAAPQQDSDPAERCTVCRRCGGALMPGYGLAAGGIGTYSVCEVCGEICNKVED